MDTEGRLNIWAVQRWPALLLKGGLALFALACIFSGRLPEGALLVGPGMMAAGVILREVNRRDVGYAATPSKTAAECTIPDSCSRVRADASRH